ncbi:MAG: tellurite resistance TerB C-terminal domain-containing protein [Synechococcales bacterium]|nr:tellurite resistance TerB C-terminal domain-containing protein [Synechococcales bacterium]
MLSSIAFGISFGVSLVFGKGDFGKALGFGGLTFFASQVGAVVAEQTREGSLRGRTDELRYQIRSLQRKRAAAYEDLLQTATERDRVATSIAQLQGQVEQLQCRSANLWQQKEALSWNLAEPTPRRTTTQIQALDDKIKTLEREEAELNRSLSTTLAAKQRAEQHFTTTQSELNQLQAQVAEQRSHKEQVLQDITALAEQKQQLAQQVAQLQEQVQSLDQYRHELNHFIDVVEPQRQQVETGSQSLQVAIAQLQQQIGSLHKELGSLEGQILERRGQKDVLDQELYALREQRRDLEERPVRSFATPWQSALSQPSPTAYSAPYPTQEKPDPSAPVEMDCQQLSLPPEWKQFIAQLPQYEFQALRAIAREKNPAPQLKQIAEANLTMPELLVDAINERALETLGDIILEPSPDNGHTIVAAEYETAIDQMIQAFEDA